MLRTIAESSVVGMAGPAPRQDEERFRRLLEAAPDAILEVDAGGRIILANAAAERMFGYARSELVGQSVEMLVPQAARAAHARHREAYTASPRSRPMGVGLDLQAQKKDGATFPVEISLSPNRSDDTANVIVIVRDVSQRNQMEAMLRRSEERLRQAEKLEALGRLAGGLAHEFNNLLAMVLGYAELLLPAVAGDEKASGHLEKISSSARRAASLTRQLLAFGRRQVLLPRVLDLNTVVVESCHIVARLLGENIETVVLPALEPAWIRADPAQIDQIMANLATNAHAAMPGGGKFKVAVSRAEVDEGNIRQHPGLEPGSYAVLSVSDTGSGMPPEVKARMFEPFFSTREFGQGRGLGLASIYGIVVQSGGGITVQSEPGAGITFEIYLPSVQPDEAAATPAEETPAESLRGTETILLVEDQEPLLDLGREFLGRMGYRVLAANLPHEALRISREFPGTIDLLLTDVVMPGVNGRELARQLSAQRPALKVLYVSGFAERAFEGSGAPGPEEAFLEKPYGFEELGKKIRDVLKAPQAPAA